MRATTYRALRPRRFARACEAFTRTVNRVRREQRAGLTAVARERANVERQIQEIVQAIKYGFRTDAMRSELVTLEDRKAELTATLTATPKPALHPRMADVFREKVVALCRGLERDEDRDLARRALHGLVDRIIVPEDGLLKLEGASGRCSISAAGRTRQSTQVYVGQNGCGGVQPAVLAAVE